MFNICHNIANSKAYLVTKVQSVWKLYLESLGVPTVGTWQRLITLDYDACESYFMSPVCLIEFMGKINNPWPGELSDKILDQACSKAKLNKIITLIEKDLIKLYYGARMIIICSSFKLLIKVLCLSHSTNELYYIAIIGFCMIVMRSIR